MKTINIWLPAHEVKALLDQRVGQLAFTTDEHGEPIRVNVMIREHNKSQVKAQALGREPREA